MSERTEKILRQVCLVLALLLIYPLARLAFRDDGLKALSAASTTVSTPPTVASGTNGSTPSRGRTGEPPPGLPEAVRLQIEKISQSEILGPVVRPQPVALVGIAGKDVFIRSSGGRTGLLRTGETLDGIKLITVGTNRVIIEEQGNQRELTLFSGFGSETLIPQPKETKP